MTSRPDPTEEGPSPLAGRLLVATPLLLDPNFYRAVVYIAEHSLDGALGVVLNRTTEGRAADHLPAWEPYLTEPAVVFIGGPIANDVAVGVVKDPEVAPSGWQPASGGVGLADLALGPDALGGVAAARVYSGYSGWVDGQLEVEIATGSWIVVSATPEDVFTADPGTLWRKVLRRQPDRRALYSSYPDDVSTN